MSTRPRNRSRRWKSERVQIAFPRGMLEGLRPAAAARDATVNDLVRRIVTEVVEAGLVDAVLDDGGAR